MWVKASQWPQDLQEPRCGTHLQCTEMGPSWPNCSLVLCTWPMKSMKPSPDLGAPCSGQSVNWNCRTVRDWPSWEDSWVTIPVYCLMVSSTQTMWSLPGGLCHPRCHLPLMLAAHSSDYATTPNVAGFVPVIVKPHHSSQKVTSCSHYPLQASCDHASLLPTLPHTLAL
jgi:hypothetical protein